MNAKKFIRARKTMRKALEKDPGLLVGYESNIAMLLHNKYGITDPTKRNRAARDILWLIFDMKWSEKK